MTSNWHTSLISKKTAKGTDIKKLSAQVPIPERTSHPFYTYDMIKEIPKGVKSTLELIRESKLEFPSPERLVFTGNGTAFYSAQMGSQVLSLSRADWKVAQAFELTNYEHWKQGGLAIGVSHSGITKSTLDALSLAKSNGAHVVGITHFPDRPISKVADKTFVIGDGPDKSRCHTKTYATSAAAVLELSLKLARPLEGELDSIRKQFENELTHKLESTVSSTEKPAREAARSYSKKISKLFFTGAGPNLVTAREAALKIKESSFLSGEALELEEILHGPWQVFDPETLVIIIAPSGPSQERARDLISACRKVGAKSIAVSDSSELDSDSSFRIPSIHEHLSPFLSIIPLYFFAYFLAVSRGNNPDLLRYLDPKYWSARQIIFPPGTH